MTGNSAGRWLILAAIVAAAIVGGRYAWLYLQPPTLPEGFASGNGRIEATEYDVATKYAGRVAEVPVNEGDRVAQGQILARMDTENLQAQQREAQARLRQAREGKNYADAIVAQRESELTYAKAEYARMLELVKKGHVSREKVDQSRTAERSAQAGLRAAQVQVVQAEAAIEAAVAGVERLESEIEDSTLRSPVDGRILYRLAEPGEVLAAGGKVLTVLELTDVYMTIFLPTHQAGRVRVGSQARIVLDAVPEYRIPARVSFIAARAQFTPKEVETRTEREKLMFRLKVTIDPALLKQHIEKVKTGVPGIAYVQLDPDAEWPDDLHVRLPE
ncbi:MAG: HlyD family efflux transporter periplasmic adaptor subunit [Gammaproteobacteria bacterium]|nr:HlyD family efflux transporter periplasmic adaptor subunit [Gammaproteobacteria bacterium]